MVCTSDLAPAPGGGGIPRLSRWNRDQVDRLGRAERRRWATTLTLALESVQGTLQPVWAARLERQSAAFTYMTYRYRGLLAGEHYRQVMSHRAVINAFTRHRRGEIDREGLGRALTIPEREAPFGAAEERYRDVAQVNTPATTGRWSWTAGDIREYPTAH